MKIAYLKKLREITSGGGGNSFTTINCPSGTDPVADSTTDTLTLAAGDNVTIVGDSATDTVTIGLASYLDVTQIADPGSPATDDFRLFVRLNGGTIELVSRAPLGDECVLCAHPNAAIAAELQLNWVE